MFLKHLFNNFIPEISKYYNHSTHITAFLPNYVNKEIIYKILTIYPK